jgi:hypothetical protein
MPAKKSTGPRYSSWGGKGGCATCGGMTGGYKKSRTQRGGAASDWVGSFYANTAIGGPAAISRATLEGIADAPMFNPLSSTATFPTNSTGIIPTGTYLAFASGVPTASQVGGARRLRKPRTQKPRTQKPRTQKPRTVRSQLF